MSDYEAHSMRNLFQGKTYSNYAKVRGDYWMLYYDLI